ncbi:MAG: hypothetical protein KF786_13775 [Burkholderiaceae bacterium]|nr:hypothetical protein [Burkholderiaceae bacterium]HMN65544.1 hypothetical protein [Burkholderiaceae bacterium]
MSAPASTPVAQSQADALIDEIARQVTAQRQAILDAAEREAGEIRARARDKARRQMRRALADLRTAERQRTRQVRAELETRARHHEAARALDLLAAAWPALDAAIARRWRDARARDRWLDAQLALAQARLPRAGWVLRHPAGWADAECDALRALLAARGASDAVLEADPRLRVGLVIEADGVRLDSTPQALLADRGFVEAALLAALPADHG